MTGSAGQRDRRPEPARTPAPGVAALLVGAAIPVTFAATVLMVVSYDTTAQAGGAATSSAAPSTAVESPVDEVVAFPDVSALPLGEAIAGLKEAGAQVSASDARGDGREIQPGWDVCAQTLVAEGDTATDRVHLDAVPAGEPCP